MNIDYIKTGNRVEILSVSDPESKKPYVCTVEAVLSKSKVLIHAPIDGGVTVRLPDNDTYMLRFYSARGIFKFTAAITEYLLVDGFKVVSWGLLDTGEKYQRRNFFRFSCTIPTRFSVISKSDDETAKLEFDGLIRDLGGGGMKMFSKYEIGENTMLSILLQLGEESLMAFGRILHREDNPRAPLMYQYGIQFSAISKIDQDKIIHYLSNEQRKLLQRVH